MSGARYGVALAAVLGLLAAPRPAAAWDFAGHRLATRLATATLPEPLRGWFEARSLWLGAWVEAGRPGLDVAYRAEPVRGTLVLVSLDGADADVLDDAVARGVMPELAAIRREGSSGRAVTALPAKTASGHAALFTGAWSPTNGIGGNALPVPGASILETGNGYNSTHLRAEPLWVTAARQGLRVSVASATQVYPFEPFGAERRFGGNFGRQLALFDGYQNLGAAPGYLTQEDIAPAPPSDWVLPLPAHLGETREIALRVAGVVLDGLLLDDPEDPAAGFDTLLVALDKDPRRSVRLKPVPARDDASAFGSLGLPLAAGPATVHFRLYELNADASRFGLAHTPPGVVRASRSDLDPVAAGVPGGFVGNGLSNLYEWGALGPTLAHGGDGSAEARYLESVALVIRQFERFDEALVRRGSWDLLVTYLPYPDEMLHAWLGHLDPALPGHDGALASRLRPFLDRGLSLVDAHLGVLRASLPPGTILALAGDHGQIGTSCVVRPNVALAQAGLLALHADGTIDLARTRAAYFPGNSGYVLINREERPGGIVSAAEVPVVVAAVRAALAGIVDPEDGRKVIVATRTPEDVLPDAPAIGGPTGGDVYLSLAPGYGVSAATRGPLVADASPTGEHLLDPERPDMHVAVAFVGPGVAAGTDLGTVRIIDVAPTTCALLGLDPPAHAEGRPLKAALAP